MFVFIALNTLCHRPPQCENADAPHCHYMYIVVASSLIADRARMKAHAGRLTTDGVILQSRLHLYSSE